MSCVHEKVDCPYLLIGVVSQILQSAIIRSTKDSINVVIQALLGSHCQSVLDTIPSEYTELVTGTKLFLLNKCTIAHLKLFWLHMVTAGNGSVVVYIFSTSTFVLYSKNTPTRRDTCTTKNRTAAITHTTHITL